MLRLIIIIIMIHTFYIIINTHIYIYSWFVINKGLYAVKFREWGQVNRKEIKSRRNKNSVFDDIYYTPEKKLIVYFVLFLVFLCFFLCFFYE